MPDRSETSPAGALLPAATVLPLRDGRHGLEVLMLHKTSKQSFGDMWVFPGGKVDPEDDDPSLPDDDLAAARRAAVREALEEADLLIELDSLVPFSHWTPPDAGLEGRKRFATWFFLAPAPVGEAGEVTIDGGEIQNDAWVRPADQIARRDRGEIDLVPPTVVTLHDLARFDTVADALAAAAAREPFRYLTRAGGSADGLVTMWAGDAGYDSGDVDAPGPRHRLTMVETGPWRYEDTVQLV